MIGDNMGTHVPYDASTEQFLNNFYTRFPLSVENQGLARMVAVNHWNQVHREVYRRYCDDEQDFQDFCAKYSDRFLDETPSQFFAELDRTVVETGLSLEAVTEKVNAFQVAFKHLFESEEKRAEAHRVSKELNDYLTPVYIALRAKGYNRKELWG
jgi:uncharacterized protein YeaO (DUF488 family)